MVCCRDPSNILAYRLCLMVWFNGRAQNLIKALSLKTCPAVRVRQHTGLGRYVDTPR